MKTVLGYLLLSIILLYAAHGLYKERKIINELIESGNVIGSKVIELPKDCTSSSRMRNFCKVEIENGQQYRLQITYEECLNLKFSDSFIIRQKDNINEIIRYNPQATTTEMGFVYILTISGLISLLSSFYYWIKNSTNHHLLHFIRPRQSAEV